MALRKGLGDESDAALALGNLGTAVLHGGFGERVPAFVEEGEALMQEGDLKGHSRVFLRYVLALATMEGGDYDSAAYRLEGSLSLFRELGDRRFTSVSLFTLGLIKLARDDLEGGAAMLEENARIARELGDRLMGTYSVLAMGKVAALRGRPVRAARLWGAAEALREQMGMPFSQFDLVHTGYERDLAAVRSALSGASFEAAWSEGRAMSPERAVEYALSESMTPHERDAHPLRRRELEVLRLVAGGMSNQEIAESLTISEHTVHRHVANVLGKLGVSSRAAAVAEAARVGLL